METRAGFPLPLTLRGNDEFRGPGPGSRAHALGRDDNAGFDRLWVSTMSRPTGGNAMLQLVPNLKRLGTETAFEVLARADALKRQGKDIINLGIGQPDFKTPAHIVEAAIKALRDGHHGYTPAQGILPLREAVAKDLKRRHDVEVSPDDIVIMPGGKPTMFFSILMFGAAGRRDHVSRPGLSHLPLDDPVHRRQAGADRAQGGERFRLHGRSGALPDQREDQPHHPQQPQQSLRRRGARSRGEAARGGPRRSTPTSPSCRTRSTARCSTAGASTRASCATPRSATG